MRLLAIPMVLVGVLVACDDPGTGLKLDTGTGDTGTLSIPLDTTPDTNGMGTQVGSEGFWGCPIERVDPIVDGSAEIPGLGGSPRSRTSQVTGEWPLQIVDLDPAGTVDGTLTLVDQGGYLWVDVAEGAGCTDHAVALVTATLVREGTTHALGGLLGLAPGASRLIVSADESESIAAVWGPSPFTTPDVTFRLDTALDPSTLDGATSYVDCDRLEAQCSTAKAVSDVDGTR